MKQRTILLVLRPDRVGDASVHRAATCLGVMVNPCSHPMMQF